MGILGAHGHTVTTAYDAEGRVLAQRGATYPVDYTYDAFGNKVSMTTYRNESDVPMVGGDALGAPYAGDTTRRLYDDATGLVTNKLYADCKGPSYDYTPDGKLSRCAWARGIVTDYTYDNAGNLTRTEYDDNGVTPTIIMAYDRVGNLTEATTVGVVTNLYAYDLQGHCTNRTFYMIKVVANMVRITLIVVICFLQGCVSQGNDIIVKSCPDFILDRITFRNCRSEILFYDLRKPDCKKTCDVAALLGKNACCSNAPWQDAALYQVAKETIRRMCLRSKQLADTNHNPQPSTMCIEIIGQEYVTDGKDDRPTDYYALRLGVKVFKSGARFRERCYTSTASARRYTCWGTASFCPLRVNDLYALFSEALTKALSEHNTEWTRNDH